MSEQLISRVEGTTLSRLRRAAKLLFVERGYHETRPQDIAREAGVASGTFYLHFADKQQAFLDFAEQAQNELLSMMGERLRSVEGRRERWQVTCAALLDFGDVNPGLLQAAFIDPVFMAPQDANAWQVYDRLGHMVRLALEEEHTDFDCELISHGLCGFLRHAMIYAGRRDLDREKMIRDLGNFIERGLRVG
ncbi:MAG: TetR/AcrR family transcriptional regulator [Gammaproteobacteria bacterium]|jgi:AcrR family transcriptional regulator|nr:TetR/AcrR family transcriptional regulator [Gammaproteobacteria bacterium]MBT7371225.1 TetR/AcrR family transcriptional regulator [Gammaproteobacteria bacterium]